MEFLYEVGPINFFNLADRERNAVLASFASAVQQLSSAVVFRIKLDRMSVVVGSDLYNVSYRRYFLESNQRLDGFLAAMGMQERFVRLVDAPGYSVNTNLPKYVVLDGGDLAKAYTIAGVASELDVAFLAMDRGEGSIIDMTDEVRIILNGYVANYNYARPHLSLKGKTPAEEAGIQVKGWRQLIENAIQTEAIAPKASVGIAVEAVQVVRN